MPSELTQGEFAYPVYLDLDMLAAWIGTRQDGLATNAERLVRSEVSAASSINGGAGVSGKVPGIASIDAKAAGGRESQQGDLEEIRETISRSHAALFSSFLGELSDSGVLKAVASTDGLASKLKAGDIVHITGSFRGNSAEKVVRALGTVLTMMEAQREAKRSALVALRDLLKDGSKAARRSGNPAKAAGNNEEAQLLQAVNEALRGMSLEDIDETDNALGQVLFQHAASELSADGVHDMVLRCAAGDKTTFSAVVPLRTEFLSEAVHGQLRDGVFSAIGKVTLVFGEEDRVNVARRSILGLLPGSQLGAMIDEMTTDELDFGTSAEDIDVVAPAIQILPLAIWT